MTRAPKVLPEDSDLYAVGMSNLDERLSQTDFGSIESVRAVLDDLLLWRDGLMAEAGDLRKRLAATNALMGAISLKAQALKYAIEDFSTGAISEDQLQGRIRREWGSPEVSPR